MSVKQHWNAELYEARHSFVWEFGKGVVELLAPKPGERILDLGCGPGQLTARLAEAGADVVGLDASPDMIGQARQNFPQLKFVLSDAAAVLFQNEFDAIFSNAALHWMLNASAVAHSMASALKPGGRLAAELGGKGNVRHIEAAIDSVLPNYYDRQPLPKPMFFPSTAEYASILESAGLEVRQAHLFDRPTALEGENGMANWLRQFSWYNFESIPTAALRDKAAGEVVEALRPALYQNGKWSVDYRRLRILAVKPVSG